MKNILSGLLCLLMACGHARADVGALLAAIGDARRSFDDRAAAAKEICGEQDAGVIATVFATLDDPVLSPWSQTGVRVGFEPVPADETQVSDPTTPGSFIRVVAPTLHFLDDQFGAEPGKFGPPGEFITVTSFDELYAVGIQIARMRREAFLCLARNQAENPELATILLASADAISTDFQRYVWMEATEYAIHPGIQQILLDIMKDRAQPPRIRRRAFDSVLRQFARTKDLDLRDRVLTIVYDERGTPFARGVADRVPAGRDDPRKITLLIDAYEAVKNWPEGAFRALFPIETTVGKPIGTTPLRELSVFDMHADHPALVERAAWVSANRAYYEAAALSAQRAARGE